MKRPTRSLIDYLILTLIVTVAVILTIYFNGNKNYQQFIIVGFSLLYVIWGVVHHLIEKTFKTKIILEYILFGILGSIVVMGLLK